MEIQLYRLYRLKVSGSNPTTLYNQVGKNHALTTESERHSSEVSNYDLKIKETISEGKSNHALKKGKSGI